MVYWFYGRGTFAFVVAKSKGKSGSFVVGKKGLSFEITQSYYDIDLLHNIAQVLGFGKVMHRQTTIGHGATRLRHVGVYYVTGKINYLKLIQLVNGRLLTPAKQKQFSAWLNRFNHLYGYNIVAKSVDVNANISFDNAWSFAFAFDTISDKSKGKSSGVY